MFHLRIGALRLSLCMLSCALQPSASEAQDDSIEALRGQHEDFVYAAALKVAETLGGEGTLVAALADPKVIHKGSILAALGREPMMPDVTVPAVLPFLDSDEWTIRRSTIETLGSMGPCASVATPKIKLMMHHDKAEENRCLAAIALAKISPQDEVVVQMLFESLGDTNVGVASAEGLGIIGPRAAIAVPKLVELLGRTRRRSYSQYYMVALGRIGEAAEPAIGLLIEILGDSTFVTRGAAAEPLRRIGPSSEKVMEALLRGLNDTLPPVRRNCARELGLMSVNGHLVKPKLELMLDDRSDEVRIAAAVSLWRHGEDPNAIVDKIVAIVNGVKRSDGNSWGEGERVIDAFAHACGLIGPSAARAVPFLTKCLTDRNSWIRRTAAQSLGNILPQGSAPLTQLQRLLDDPDLSVQKAARAAIIEISSRPANVN